jgi:CheY-like chemotaxis protein
VKFTPAGRIDVRVETDADEARVVVDDTGIGIDPSFLPSIFDRFSQADGSPTRQYGGLGLGLAIVRQLTELHGGRVEATSAGPGQGARFTITLPRADRGELTPGPATDRARARAADRASGGELEGLRILVVDDDPDELELLHAILEGKAAHVTTTASAAEALAAFEREPFDVVISDIGMPGEDGYSLLRRIRALPAAAGGGVCAIALTAYARSTDRLAALTAGFHQHVAKPVSPNELTGVVASLVRNRRPVELG